MPHHGRCACASCRPHTTPTSPCTAARSFPASKLRADRITPEVFRYVRDGHGPRPHRVYAG